MKKAVLLLLILCLTYKAKSQIKVIERLSQELSVTVDDKKKVILLADIGYYYRLSNIDTAFIVSRKALALAKKINYDEGEANALSTIGSIYRMAGDIQNAMLNQFECVSIAKKNGYDNELAKAYLAMGIVYSDIKDFNLAIHYMKLSEGIYKTLNKPDLLNANIANLGEVYFRNNQLDSALYYLQIAHQSLLIESERNPVLPFTFSRLSMVYLKLEKYDSAYNYAHKAIELGKDNKNMRVQIKGYQILSEYYQLSDKIDSAIIYAHTAHHLARIYNYKLDILENCNLLANLYEHTDLKKSFDYTKNAIQLNDSLYGVKKVNALQKKILEEQNIIRENEARLLESRNQIKLNILLFCLILASLVGLILYRNNIQKQKANILLQKQKEEINFQKSKVEKTLSELRSTQDQLIQSDRLAVVGKLVANVAHEINTPLGAIRASAGNIAVDLTESLIELPKIYEILDKEKQKIFFELIAKALANKQLATAKEERQIRKVQQTELESVGVPNADDVAYELTSMGLYEGYMDFLPLYRDENAHFILQTAYHLVNQQRSTDNIQVAVDRASKVVFALKTYARQDHLGEKVRATLKNGLETVLILYHNLLKQGVEVTRDYQANPELWCYPDELAQVWTNMIHNALQAMNHKGKLLVSMKEENKSLIVSFTDTGKGIPDDIKPKIFEPFFTTKPIGEGSGLGLDICQKIVKKHQGEIGFESEVGKGTTFWVKLPIGI